MSERVVVVSPDGRADMVLSRLVRDKQQRITAGFVENGAWSLLRDPESDEHWSAEYPERRHKGYLFYEVPNDIGDPYGWGEKCFRRGEPTS